MVDQGLVKKLRKGVSILDHKVILKVSKDCMEAILEGELDPIDGNFQKRLSEILKEYGIVHGIMDEPEQISPKCIVLARGTQPEHGRDGRIEIVAESWRQAHDASLKEIKELKRLHKILNVSKGEIIAKRILPTRGTPGKDLFGRQVPPKPGAMKFFKLGDLVEILDENTLVASADGALKIEKDGKISVVTSWVVEGDVDWSTGHVEFFGKKLHIKGSVKGGFTVEANGDVLIEKNIEDEAVVLAGGNLTVKGIIRSQYTMVKTGKSLECKKLEYSRAFVGGDLIIEDYALDAECMVHGSVFVTKEKGLIAGGKFFMGGSLDVKTLGTKANVPTIIGAGIDPMLQVHYKSIVKDQEILVQKLQAVEEGLSKISLLERSCLP